MKVGLFLRRVGPYHYARFKEASKETELHIIETRPKSQEYPWEFNPENHVNIYKLGNPPEPEKGFRGRILIQKVDTIINKIAPEVIVTVGWADPEYHAVFIIAKKMNIPLVLVSDSTYGDFKRYILFELMKRQIVRNFNTAIVAGKRSKAYLMGLGFNGKKIFEPWDVVDNAYFVEKVKQRGMVNSILSKCTYRPGYFLCVSRLIEKKNLLGLIEAYKNYCESSEKPRKLLILGSGELQNNLENRAGKLLNTSIFFPGFMQYDELPAFYAGAYFLILPSFYDQWGLVVNEAMASGIPVIVSKQCGSSDDLVRNEKTGFTFNAQNIQELTNIFVQVDRLNDSDYQDMQHKCRSLIAERFGLTDFSSSLKEACNQASRHSRRDSFLNTLISNCLIYR